MDIEALPDDDCSTLRGIGAAVIEGKASRV